MITLGIAAEHNSSACLMFDGRIVGLIQEERLTKLKNQVAFPLRAIERLVAQHLDGDTTKIDQVVVGGTESDPYFAAIDRYSNVTIEDHIREMHELWHPHFYGGKRNDGSFWRDMYLDGRQLNSDHNFDFSFLKSGDSWSDDIRHFCEVERPSAVRRHLGFTGTVETIDHHECHAYYAVYGAPIPIEEFANTLILTGDAYGDGNNWSASIVEADGSIRRLSAGDQQLIARIYKYCTLILGMKPNEHEYKVMGLSGYSKSSRHIKVVEDIFFEALDFRDGKWVSDNPLPDSYFALRDRLEGHRFDNIAAGMQNWATELTKKWAAHWIRKTGRTGVCFSGGLSMNIKSNGALLDLPELDWLSVPASGGDESLCVGACYALHAGKNNIVAMPHVYLGELAGVKGDEWSARLKETKMTERDFTIIEDIGPAEIAKLLAADWILARCVGAAEFGARSLGNRTILANPANAGNVKLINDAIKNRDFWMPFTPSILAEYAEDYIDNPKSVISPYMTIGFESKAENRSQIIGGLHGADYSARPQYVLKNTNPEFWEIIDQFRVLTGIPALVNTSLNLHGEPMNYSLADAARTVALSDLSMLSMPENQLLCKNVDVDAVLSELVLSS
jgi:carbamoyltransferase